MFSHLTGVNFLIEEHNSFASKIEPFKIFSSGCFTCLLLLFSSFVAHYCRMAVSGWYFSSFIFIVYCFYNKFVILSVFKMVVVFAFFFASNLRLKSVMQWWTYVVLTYLASKENTARCNILVGSFYFSSSSQDLDYIIPFSLQPYQNFCWDTSC